MSDVNKLIADRYLLKELIGQGGMADVYLAEDQILNRTVAVKILRSSLTGDPIYIKRFHREASAAAAISHKNIVSIYDVGEEDVYYIVMEYVKGQTLKELIHIRGALYYIEALDIMKQVTSAVALAHDKGIIHRDLKPQNILVTDSGIVKITDFGIASVESLSQVTQTDTIMGSLHYLAPEIARGEKATVQSDIYSLGIVFYELLRGEVPFNGESPVNIALKHMRDEIPSVKEFNHNIPQSVENIIIKATAKNLSNRYKSASEMLDDLQTCLERNEEKLVFAAPVSEPTIIAGNTEFFTKDKDLNVPKEETPVKPKRQTRSQMHQDDIVEEVEEPKKKPKKWKKYLIAFLALVLLAGGGIGIFFFRQANQEVKMPNVVGLTLKEGKKIIKNKKLVVADKIYYELSDEYEKDIIISSDPKVDTSLKKGDEVVLTVSKGKYIVMEDFKGQTYDDALEKLEELGYTVTKYEKTDDTYEKGVVIDQSISAGEKQDPDSEDKKITLTVSKGVIITVPSLYGENVETAKKSLTKLGFKTKLIVLDPPTDENEIKNMTTYTVVKQSIEPYTQVYKKGKTIKLYYYNKKPTIKKPSTTTEEENTEEDSNTTDNTQ